MSQLVKNLPTVWETWFDTWVGKIPWRREWLTTPVFWPGKFHGLYSPWGHKESDTTEQLSLTPSELCISTLIHHYHSEVAIVHGSQRVRHDWATLTPSELCIPTLIHHSHSEVAIHPMGLDKCRVTRAHQCSITWTSFTARKTSELSWFIRPYSQSLKTILLLHSFAFSRMSYKQNHTVASLSRSVAFI